MNTTSKLARTTSGGSPAGAREVRAVAEEWGAGARRFARNNPVIVLAGAFAVGVLLARAARHA